MLYYWSCLTCHSTTSTELCLTSVSSGWPSYYWARLSIFELQVSAGTMVIALLLVLFDLPFHHLHRAVSHFCVVWVAILLLGKTIYQLQTVPEGFFVCGTTYVNKVCMDLSQAVHGDHAIFSYYLWAFSSFPDNRIRNNVALPASILTTFMLLNQICCVQCNV